MRRRLLLSLGLIGLSGLLAYLGAAVYFGQHRLVLLVSGATQPYEVTLAGRKINLTPGTQIPIFVAEGDLSLTVAGADLGDLPPHVRVATNFWTRPFVKHTLIINPDGLGLVHWEEVEYTGGVMTGGRPGQLHIGQLLYQFEGVDYEHEPFPRPLEAASQAHFLRTRVAIETPGRGLERITKLKNAVPETQQADYARRILRIDPADSGALSWLFSKLEPSAMLEELRPRLADRPVRVDWHRIYQVLMDETKPEVDLRPEYRRFVDEAQRSGDALHLLARIETGPAAEALYRESVTAQPPSARARSAMAFRLLSRGEFAEALQWIIQARALDPDDAQISHLYREVIVASGLFQHLAFEVTHSDGWDYRDQLLARIGLNDRAGTDVIFADHARRAAAYGPDARKHLDILRACLEQNRAAFLHCTEGDAENCESLLLRGKLTEAVAHLEESAVKMTRPNQRIWLAGRHGLVCLAAQKAGAKVLAQEQLTKTISLLERCEREARDFGLLLAGRTPFELQSALQAPLRPEEKRVLLAVLATQHPTHTGPLNVLAKKLDYQRDAVSLCLVAMREKK